METTGNEDEHEQGAEAIQASGKGAKGAANKTRVLATQGVAGMVAIFSRAKAVIILSGLAVYGGVTRIVKKRFEVRAKQREHLEQLKLTETKTADHFTVLINGVGEEGQFNAVVSSTDDASYPLVSAGYLKGVSKLISGSSRCNVRDMGNFTQDIPTPFNVRISVPDVLALMRQSWKYERFCQTKCGTMTVIVLRSQRNRTKLRVAWENSGSLDYTKAVVYTVNEWKKTPYAGKTTTMADGVADVDMALNKTLVFE